MKCNCWKRIKQLWNFTIIQNKTQYHIVRKGGYLYNTFQLLWRNAFRGKIYITEKILQNRSFGAYITAPFTINSGPLYSLERR